MTPRKSIRMTSARAHSQKQITCLINNQPERPNTKQLTINILNKSETSMRHNIFPPYRSKAFGNYTISCNNRQANSTNKYNSSNNNLAQLENKVLTQSLTLTLKTDGKFFLLKPLRHTQSTQMDPLNKKHNSY